MEQPIELTDGNFRSRLQDASGIVLFHKRICPHCKALKKVIEKVTVAIPTLTVMQIDSESNPAAMAELEVERIPTLLLVEDGRVAKRKTGLMNARELTAWIQSS
ncbi:MAG: thioredoxin family protein [Proteobacteria bacterium]|nr:thioredoxin family protein [Pseudomonadota bacterium]